MRPSALVRFRARDPNLARLDTSPVKPPFLATSALRRAAPFPGNQKRSPRLAHHISSRRLSSQFPRPALFSCFWPPHPLG